MRLVQLPAGDRMGIDVTSAARDSSELPAPMLNGDLIAGKYRVERLLGMGGMGVVVAAWHVELERRVALKLVRGELATDEAAMQRLILEARAAAKLTNEHACRVLDVGRLESGAPYLVMEFLEGSDLADVLQQRGSIPVDEAVDWILQACEALAEAHSCGIVHRDLKPENLFLARGAGAASIKVLDFGISKRLGRPERALTNPGTALGSPQYMAPEQMLAEESVDERVDIWALGAIIYELIGGKAAFEGDSLPAICAKVLEEAPARLGSHAPNVQPLLETVIHRCLSKDREARFRSIVHLARELAPFGSELAHQSVAKVCAFLPLEPWPAGAAPADTGLAGPALPKDPASDSALRVLLRPARRRWLAAIPIAVLGSGLLYALSDWSPPLASSTPGTRGQVSDSLRTPSEPVLPVSPTAPAVDSKTGNVGDRTSSASTASARHSVAPDADSPLPRPARAARERRPARTRLASPRTKRTSQSHLDAPPELPPPVLFESQFPAVAPDDRVDAWDMEAFGERR